MRTQCLRRISNEKSKYRNLDATYRIMIMSLTALMSFSSAQLIRESAKSYLSLLLFIIENDLTVGNSPDISDPKENRNLVHALFKTHKMNKRG